MICWLNDRLLPLEQAYILASDRGFTLGDGIFETMRAAQGQVPHWPLHWNRLQDGAAVLRLSVPFDLAGGAAILQNVLAANGLESAAMRLTISRGPGQRGLLPPNPGNPTVLVTCAPVPPVLGPATLCVARSVRRNPLSPLSRCKTLSYLDNVLARMEAEEAGCDDALILNPSDYVVETSIANIFAVLADGRLVTPPLSHGPLPGISRQRIMQDLNAEEAPVTLDDLTAAQEIFITNSLSVRPVVTINQTAMRTGTVWQQARDVVNA